MQKGIVILYYIFLLSHCPKAKIKLKTRLPTYDIAVLDFAPSRVTDGIAKSSSNTVMAVARDSHPIPFELSHFYLIIHLIINLSINS